MSCFSSLFDRFVLCEECENPETVIKANTRKGLLVATCKACGHSFQLDMRHKLTTFILKVIAILEGPVEPIFLPFFLLLLFLTELSRECRGRRQEGQAQGQEVQEG